MGNEDLLKIAKNARLRSVCPLSSYAVGAALLSKSGTVYIGTNIEDKVIMSLSNCAERVAIQNAITHGDREILKIAVVGGKKDSNYLDNTVPCGVCLQYMLNLDENIEVIFYNDGEVCVKKVKDFFVQPFKLD